MLDKFPPQLKRMMEVGLSMQSYSGPPIEILKKVNEQHITKALEIAEKEGERVFEDTKSARRYMLVYVIIFVGLFIFATIYLVGKETELYKEILKLLVIFLGGLGSGFGLKGFLDKERKP